jgi:pantetheine-phosphate adenylyltransferase
MKKDRAIYPGSFDPITFGHVDVIRRAAEIFDELVVAVAENESKHPLFTVPERLAMIRAAIGNTAKVRVEALDGLLVDYAARNGIYVVIRGLRAVSDFEFEFQMALMNRRLEPRLETIFLTPQEEHTFLSSRIVKEVARLGGDVSSFVPTEVAARLRDHQWA